MIVENALIVPPEASARRLRHGVFDARGRFVAASAALQSHGRPSRAPALRPAEAELAGTHLYAGVGRAHFGHFLLESVTRHHALAGLSVDSVLFAPMPGRRMRLAEGPLFDLHDVLSGGAPVGIVPVPTRVERLLVPEQGFGHGALLAGTPAFRAHAGGRLRELGAEGPARLYVSRSELRERKEAMDGEDLVEARLRRAGYTIFHPQQHSLAAQCRHYRAAEIIVGSDGSAFHLAALVARPEARVGIILRRNRPEMLERLAVQLRAFAGIEPVCINAVTPPRVQRTLAAGMGRASVPLDLDQVFAELEAAGLL